MPYDDPVDERRLERWRGGVDEKLRGHEDDIRDLRGVALSNQSRIGALEVRVGRIAAQIGIAAAMGSLIGGGLVTLAVWLISKTAGH